MDSWNILVSCLCFFLTLKTSYADGKAQNGFYPDEICNSKRVFKILWDVWKWNVNFTRSEIEQDQSNQTKIITDLNKLEGYGVDVFRKFLEKCPIKFELHQNPDDDWGKKTRDGKFTGLLKRLAEDDYSFTLNQYSNIGDKDWLTAFSYTHSTKRRTLSIVIKNESKFKSGANHIMIIDSFFAAFSPDATWALILVVIACLIIAIVIAKLQETSITRDMLWDVIYGVVASPSPDVFRSETGQAMKKSDIEEIAKCIKKDVPIVDNSAVTLLSQIKTSIKDSLNELPIRIYSLGWLFFCFMFLEFLSAEIHSNMTVDKMKPRINSLADIMKDSELKIFWNMFYVNKFMLQHRDTRIEKLVEKYNQWDERPNANADFYNFTIVDKYMKTRGDVVYISTWDYLNTEMTTGLLNSCDVHIVEDDYITLGAGFLFSRNESKLLQVFNQNIQEMEANGEMSKNFRKWFGSNKDRGCGPSDIKDDRIGLQKEFFYPIIMLTMVAMGVALLLALFNRLATRLMMSTPLSPNQNEN